MKSILALTDFSPVANNAVHYAAKFAQAFNTNLVLFHTFTKNSVSAAGNYEDDADNNGSIVSQILQLEAVKKNLQHSFGKDNKRKPGLTCIAEDGSLAEGARATVKRGEIGLIIMGARLYYHFRKFLFGDNVRAVIDGSVCPVLLIPENAPPKLPGHIFYGTDLRRSDPQMTSLLADIVGPLSAAVTMLHVGSAQNADLADSEAASMFTTMISTSIKYPSVNYLSLEGVDADAAIDKIISSRKVDMLAVIHHKYHFFEQVFKAASPKNLALYTNIPLLIMPQNKETANRNNWEVQAPRRLTAGL